MFILKEYNSNKKVWSTNRSSNMDESQDPEMEAPHSGGWQKCPTSLGLQVTSQSGPQTIQDYL